MISFIKYSLWPAVKVRGIYWWWILKYGGKKNIPPELIFGAMERSMQRMDENIKNALRAMPEDASEEEQQMMRDLLRESARLEQMRKEAQRESSH